MKKANAYFHYLNRIINVLIPCGTFFFDGDCGHSCVSTLALYFEIEKMWDIEFLVMILKQSFAYVLFKECQSNCKSHCLN